MKITPLEIRQKSFEKEFRGYDKDEVDAFLMSLSHEWERHTESQKDLKRQLVTADMELKKLREVESSLFKTLKTAEDTGANLIDQANKSAELHLRETHLKTEALMHEAKNKAKSIIEEAQYQANRIVDELDEEVRKLEHKHRQLEDVRETMLADLKSISNGVLERVNKMDNDPKRFVAEDLVHKSKQAAYNMKAMLSEPTTLFDLSGKGESLAPEVVPQVEMSETDEIRKMEKLTHKDDKTMGGTSVPIKDKYFSEKK